MRCGVGQPGEREAGEEHGEAGRDCARHADAGRFAEQPDPDGHAGHRGDRGDDRQRENGPAGLVCGLRQQHVTRPADDHGVDRPGGSDGSQAVARSVGERHRHDRRAGIRQPRRHGQQDRAAASRRPQADDGGRQRGAPGGGSGQGHRRKVVRLADRVTVTRRGQRQERRDGSDDRQRRGPDGPAERAPRPDAHDDHRDDELAGNHHLHGRQRPRPQRDRVRREPADLHRDTQQPQGLACQQEQQPGPPRRRPRRRRRLPLLQRRPGPIEDGGGQRGRDHHNHGHHARSDVSRRTIRKIPHSGVGLAPPHPEELGLLVTNPGRFGQRLRVPFRQFRNSRRNVAAMGNANANSWRYTARYGWNWRSARAISGALGSLALPMPPWFRVVARCLLTRIALQADAEGIWGSGAPPPAGAARLCGDGERLARRRRPASGATVRHFAPQARFVNLTGVSVGPEAGGPFGFAFEMLAGLTELIGWRRLGWLLGVAAAAAVLAVAAANLGTHSPAPIGVAVGALAAWTLRGLGRSTGR
jgi:hypothetical protein